jgi:hypothetical protein
VISNLPTLAVATLSAGGNPTLECNASPFISEHKFQNSKIKNQPNIVIIINLNFKI